MKYATGPWKVVPKLDGMHGMGIMAVNDGYRYVAEVCVHNQQLANANLMAAAPEMYEALKACELAIGSGINADPELWRDAQIKMEKAIAKAEGRSE